MDIGKFSEKMLSGSKCLLEVIVHIIKAKSHKFYATLFTLIFEFCDPDRTSFYAICHIYIMPNEPDKIIIIQ